MEYKTSHSVKSIVLLLVFVLLKVGLAHSLTHALDHDDFNDCEQCVLIVDSNKTKTFSGHLCSFSNTDAVEDVLSKPYPLLYTTPLFRAHQFIFFFNKPPPLGTFK